MKYFNLKSKIIVTTLLCVFFVSMTSNVLLYHYFADIILEKSTSIDIVNLDSLESQLEDRIDDAYNLVALCISDDTILNAATYSDLSTLSAKQAAVSAQEQLNLLLSASSIWSYADKLILFNTDGLIVQGYTNISGSPIDYSNLVASSFIQESISSNIPGNIQINISRSIAWSQDVTVAIIAPTYTTDPNAPSAFIYLELNLSIFTDLLSPFADVQEMLIASNDDTYLISSNGTASALVGLFSDLNNGDTFTLAGKKSLFHARDLTLCNISLYSYSDLSIVDNVFTLLGFPVIIMILTCSLLSIFLALMLSTYITQPINRIITRIKRISANDFSYDPTIEKSNDEFGQIGRLINEMILSVDNLVHQTKEMSEHRKNIEINLLQSQVNPHFLYNTLDSVYWMAVIQKNQSIANMIRSLINLLKNIAKGTDDKIPLSEELTILQDYVHIQSVRYLETFSFSCDIPSELLSYTIIKLSLQPLVENAIFHGIEPTGKSGTIRLSAHETEHDIVLQVADDGVGMNEEQCKALLTIKENKKRSKTSMNGIGVSNVHTRLQLVYGKAYGLSVESTIGIGTTVSIKIPKEKS